MQHNQNVKPGQDTGKEAKRAIFNESKKKAKRAVAIARAPAHDELYKSLDIHKDCIVTSVMADLELEKQYMPEQWSIRFSSPQQVLENHIQVVTAASEEAIINIPHKLEIPYGPTFNQKLDVFGTDLPMDSPILVYVHGGFWQILNRTISRYPAGPLYRAGVKTIVVGYDLCPAVTLPDIVQQIHNAARFVFEYAENMGSRGVYFAGHSAGGHLIAKLLSNAEFLHNTPGSDRLQGAFLISGVFDLRELVLTSTVNDAVRLPIEWAVPLSPLFDSYFHLQARRVQLYILAAQHDSPAFKKQSREFYNLMLNTCLAAYTYFEIKNGFDHFDIVECLANDENYLKNLLVHNIRNRL